jgi:hypothetical protein
MIVPRAVRRGGLVPGATLGRALAAAPRRRPRRARRGPPPGPSRRWRHLPEADRWALVRYIRTLAAK